MISLSLALQSKPPEENYRPDLIVALAHGVWGVLRAVEAYWASSKAEQAFPPVMVSIIGREKMERYERVRENLPCARNSPLRGRLRRHGRPWPGPSRSGAIHRPE